SPSREAQRHTGNGVPVAVRDRSRNRIGLGIPGTAEPDAAELAAGAVAVAVRRARVPRVVVPAAAPYDSVQPTDGSGGITNRRARVVFAGIPIRHPLPHIPSHVLQTVRAVSVGSTSHGLGHP